MPVQFFLKYSLPGRTANFPLSSPEFVEQYVPQPRVQCGNSEDEKGPWRDCHPVTVSASPQSPVHQLLWYHPVTIHALPYSLQFTNCPDATPLPSLSHHTVVHQLLWKPQNQAHLLLHSWFHRWNAWVGGWVLADHWWVLSTSLVVEARECGWASTVPVGVSIDPAILGRVLGFWRCFRVASREFEWGERWS